MISNIRVTGVKYDSTENILKRAVEESSDISDKKKDENKEMFDHPVPDEDFEIRVREEFDFKGYEPYVYTSSGEILEDEPCKNKVNIKG